MKSLLTIFVFASLCSFVAPTYSPKFTSKSILTRIFVDIKTTNMATTTYYVSTVNPAASDSNAGTSSDLPFLTIGKATSVVVAGDVILLEGGSIFRETVNSSQNTLTFGRFAFGADPIISGADLKSSGWTRQSANVWKVAATTQPQLVLFNKAIGVKQSTLAAVTQSFYWYWASNILYVWSPNDTDPSTFYVATSGGVEAANRKPVFNTNNKTNQTLNNLKIQASNSTGLEGALRTGATTTDGLFVNSCTIELNRQDGIEIRSTSTANVVINGCTIQNNGLFGYLGNYSAAATGTNEIKFSNINNNGWAWVIDAQQSSNIQGNLGNLFIHDNSIQFASNVGNDAAGTNHGIYVSTSSGAYVWIYNNVISNNPNGNGIKARFLAWIYNNTFANNRIANVDVGGNGNTDVTAYIIGNYSTATVNGFPFVNQTASGGSGKISINIYNNSSYKTGGISSEISINSNIDTLRIVNNIFIPAAGRYVYVFAVSLTHTTLINYNNGYDPTLPGWKARNNGTIYATLALWKAALVTYDQNSLSVDPQFIAPPANLAILNTSPMFGAGTSTTGGIPVPPFYNAYDLGAYQVPYPLSNRGIFKDVSPH